MPDILSLDALVKAKTWQRSIIPGVTVQMDTPWMDSGQKRVNINRKDKTEARFRFTPRSVLILVEVRGVNWPF